MSEPEKRKTTIEIAMEKAEKEKREKAIDTPMVDKMQRSPVVKK